MRPTRIVLIDMSGAGNSLFPTGQLKNCVFTQATSRESEVLLHLLTHDMVIIVDSDFSQDLLALVQLIHATTPRKPIVAITSEPNSQQVVAAYRAGLSDYCFLPLEQNKLCDLLQSFCEKRRFFNKILQNISSTIASGSCFLPGLSIFPAVRYCVFENSNAHVAASGKKVPGTEFLIEFGKIDFRSSLGQHHSSK